MLQAPVLLALPGVHTRKNKTGRERAKEVGGGRRRSFQFSVSQSGFVNMKCAVRFAKDKMEYLPANSRGLKPYKTSMLVQ